MTTPINPRSDPVSPWRDEARQAMQVIISSAAFLPEEQREPVERSIHRLDGILRQLDMTKTGVSRDEVIERVAFRLWKRTVGFMAAARQKEVWSWMPPAQRRQWLEEARELVDEILP